MSLLGYLFNTLILRLITNISNYCCQQKIDGKIILLPTDVYNDS